MLYFVKYGAQWQATKSALLISNCVSAMGTYTFDQDGKLTRTESSYDPADMPKGDDMPEATSGADTSTSSN